MAQTPQSIGPTDLETNPSRAKSMNVEDVLSKKPARGHAKSRDTSDHMVGDNYLDAKTKMASTAKTHVSKRKNSNRPGPSNDSHARPSIQQPPSMLSKVTEVTLGFSRSYRAQDPSSDSFSSQEQGESTNHNGDLATSMQSKEVQLDQLCVHYHEMRNVYNEDIAKTHVQTQKWQHTAEQLQQECAELRQERDKTVSRLQEKFRGAEREKQAVQDRLNTFVRRQQEVEFRRMESGKWAPDEESTIINKLERVKRDMKGLAKQIAMKDMSKLDILEEAERNALMLSLSRVVALEKEGFPPGLETAKSPSLLLNALLAHAVYNSFFSSPFFFLKGGSTTELDRNGQEKILDDIYEAAQTSNPHDAHVWRSQTMRLLLPQLGNNATKGEENLHESNKANIAKAAEQQASIFLTGPARHLIDTDTKIDYNKKVRGIYQEAATLSYRLWTRRTALKFSSLHELKNSTFNIENPRLLPHTLVKYDDHEDKLKGRPITVIVHPLLEVYGTDEAENYENARVWMAAEVWLDSKVAEASK